MKRIYLDYAATTPVAPEVVTAMTPYFTEVFGNPSSIYYCGQEARGAVEEAREKVARLLGAQPEEIVFTGGGSEADNYALVGAAYANETKGNHIIVSSVEHHAVLETARFLKTRGFRITTLSVDEHGLVDPDDVRKAITPRTILISVMHGNNEVGTVEPVTEIGQIARAHNIYFHTDAVQTVGHIPINVKNMNIDLLALSAHKMYGPKGIGALYVRRGVRLTPLIHGGGQERGRRAGTENVPNIVGLGNAAEMAQREMISEAERLTILRERMIKGLLSSIEDVRLNGHPERRLPNNVNISVEFIEGESMCLNLDLAGVCVSTGSACSSSSLEPSHVLLAMGIPPEKAHGSLRFTTGKWTTEEDIDRTVDILAKVVSKLRAMSPLYRRQKQAAGG